MKKSLVSISFLSFALMSCGDNSNDMTNSVQNSATVITATSSIITTGLPSDATEFILTVTADADWSISSDSQWITHFPSGGVKNESTNITVYVASNNDFDPRDGVLTIKSGNTTKEVSIHQYSADQIEISDNNLMCGSVASTFTISLKSNVAWSVIKDADWCSVDPQSGNSGEESVVIKVAENTSDETRTSVITFTAGSASQNVALTQYADVIDTPEGYTLVWNDEFNEGTTLGSDWTYEVQSSGWVNNELQNYVKNPVDGKNTVEIDNGFLNINCFKATDGKVYSGRVYAKVNIGWTYGYFEARINLPSGKGTWPAFWMMPVNFTGWPDSGEIDIMEEVGTVPNEVSSSLHALGHYHVEGTQITKARTIDNAEGDFHTYALEWTSDLITTYVDGIPLLTYANDGGGDYNWPYHTPFYVILNLAWGGDWGGMNGVDETALPVTLLVDYVRVFQKK